jgi:hypothetical protein
VIGATTANSLNASASIWAALASSTLSSETITVTWQTGYTSFTKRATAISFYNHHDTSVLANNFGTPVVISDSAGVAAAVTVTAGFANSYVVTSMVDWNSATTRTVRGDSIVIESDHDDGAGDLYMAYRSLNRTSGSGSVTVGTSAPTNARLWAVGVEVLSA